MTTVLKTVTNVYKLTARFFCISNRSVRNTNRPVRNTKKSIEKSQICELINYFDIVCFVETKTDDIDVIDFPGFIFTAEDI